MQEFYKFLENTVYVALLIFDVQERSAVTVADNKDTMHKGIESFLSTDRLQDQIERSLLDNLTIQITYLDPELRIVWYNNEVEKTRQLDLNRTIGQKCHKAYYGLSQPCPDCPLPIMLKKGEACTGIHQDQNNRSWHLSVSPNYNKEGKLLGLVYVSYEITEFKKTEEALHRNTVMLRNLIDHSRRLIFAKDLEGRFILVSKSMVDLHGFKTADEMIGLTNYDFLPKGVADQLTHDDQQVINSGEAIQLEERIANEKGTFTFLTIKFPLFNEQNQVYAVCGISADISERVHLEEELKKYRTLLDTTEKISKVGGWQYDVIQDKITWTAETYRIHGLEPEISAQEAAILIEKSISCYKPEDRATVLDHFTNCMKNGVPYDLEFKFTNFAGREMWVRTIAEAESSNGKIVRVTGNIADITEIKEARDVLTQISYQDPLTGLYNRRYLEAEVKRLDTERQLPLAIIVSDLNNLKQINDLYGHETGDKMILSAARAIKKGCREEDIVARWGGDEFVILLPQTDQNAAAKICRRILNNCQKSIVAGHSVSIALGLAVKDGGEQSITDLFTLAEKEMYADKLKRKTEPKGV